MNDYKHLLAKKAHIVGYIEEMVSGLELTDTQLDRIRTSYEAVGTHLTGCDALQGFQPRIFAQGSVSLGTTVRPIHDDQHFDVDLVCKLEAGHPGCNQAGIHALVGNGIKEHGAYTQIIAPLKRGWRLEYAESSRFHLDITPAVPQLGCPLKSVHVPDRERKQWQPSNPEGYAQRFKHYAGLMPRFAGGTTTVSVTMRNTGTQTWVSRRSSNNGWEPYTLGSQNPQDNTRWGIDRVRVSNDYLAFSVKPGKDKTFTFNIVAPKQTGKYNFQWRMVHGVGAWFGASSPNKIITVIDPPTHPIIAIEVNGMTVNGGESKVMTTANGATLTFNYSAYDSNGKSLSTHLMMRLNGGAFAEIASSNVAAGTFSYTLSSAGSYEFHCYAGDASNNQSPPAILTVTVSNRPPDLATVTLSANTIYYGQGVTVTGTLRDHDGDLHGHNLWVVPPASDGSVNQNWNPIGRPLSPDWWGGPCSDSGWSGPVWNMGKPSNNTTSTVTGIFTPSCAGSWQVHTNGCDTSGAWGPGDTKILNVAKTTPLGTFGSKTIIVGTALGTLNASFVNPHNPSLPVSGTITYAIVAGGAGAWPNGTTVTAGAMLPIGVYTIRASLQSNDNYTAASADATFTVSSDPTAAPGYVKFPNGDALSNEIKNQLNLNPNASATSDPATLDVNVHTPTKGN